MKYSRVQLHRDAEPVVDLIRNPASSRIETNFSNYVNNGDENANEELFSIPKKNDLDVVMAETIDVDKEDDKTSEESVVIPVKNNSDVLMAETMDDDFESSNSFVMEKVEIVDVSVWRKINVILMLKVQILKLNVYKKNKILFQESISDNSLVKRRQMQSKTAMTFTDLIESRLDLPLQWAKSVVKSEDGSRVLHFYKATIKKKNGIQDVVILKEVCIAEDLGYYIKCLGQTVDPGNIGLKFDDVSSVSDVQELLDLVDSCSICAGHKIDIEYDSKVSYKDKSDCYRHRKCPILKVLPYKLCSFCGNLRRSINRKRKFANENTDVPVKNMKLRLSNIPEKQKQKIMNLQKKKEMLSKKCKRLKKQNETLRQELSKVQRKLSQTSSTTLDNILNQRQITEYQREAIQEIVKACQHSNSKGRRYSESWILLCLLLHMRSPKTYKFLYEQGILC